LPFLILYPVRDLRVVYTVFFVFRPLNSQEVDCVENGECFNDTEVRVKRPAYSAIRPEKITRTFTFDRVFGPSSSQVNNFRYASH
jgi:hypothetical protein